MRVRTVQSVNDEEVAGVSDDVSEVCVFITDDEDHERQIVIRDDGIYVEIVNVPGGNVVATHSMTHDEILDRFGSYCTAPLVEPGRPEDAE